MLDNLIELFLADKAGKQIFDSLPIAIYATDNEGRLTYFNSAAVKLSGRVPELNTDQWCVNWKLYYPDGSSMPHDECPMAISLKNGKSMTGVEAIAERPDGERIWFKAYPMPLFNDKGEVIAGINMLVDITAQKEIEKQLRRKKNELADFFDNFTVGLHWVGTDGIVKQANQATLDMLGYTRDEFVGSHIEDCYVEQEVVRDILQKLSTGEELRDYEVRLKCKDGSTRHVLISTSGYYEGGEYVHGWYITIDITRNKQTQGKLRDVTLESDRQRRLFEAVISSTPDLIYVFDLNYRFTFVNDALLDMWGLSLEESIGKSLLEIGYEPWHAEMHESEIDQVIATKQPIQGEVSFPHSKLGRRIYDYIFVPVFDQNGRVEAVAGTTRDITARKQAEEALRKSEEKYRTLFEMMDEGVDIIEMIFDENNKPTDFRYLETNPASDKHSGLRNRKGKKINEILSSGIEEDWLKSFGTVALTGEPVQFEKRVGELQRWFEVSAFRTGRPEERKVAVIYKNINDRKYAQERLKLLNETLEERVQDRTSSLLSYQAQLRLLASQLNKTEENQRHQLATELHDNLGQVLALGKMKLDQLQKNQFSEQTFKEFEELKEIIESALKYTRDLMSDLKPPPSIDDDIPASIDWIADKLEKHGLSVTIEDDKLPKPLDEEVRATVHQCVRELLFNVIKHTSEKKAVVSLRVIEGQLKINVKDEGEGFDTENLEFIPENNGRFGLFNIQERIGLLGGKIDIKSQPGRGTKVTLYIPLAEESKLAGPPGQDIELEQVTKPKSETRIKVLIADDHQMFRKGVRKIIEGELDIMVIDEAADGEEAIKKARETSPDVILMDVNMPRMDGIEATRRITADMPNIRIIGLSLYEEAGVVEEMRKAGASAYLTKTEAFESLIVSIRAEASSSSG